MKEILEFFDKNPSVDGKYYYLAIFQEYQKLEDQLSQPEIIKLLEEGVEKEHSTACAAKLLFLHIEPCRLNNGLPDYDCEKGLNAVLKVIKEKGILEYCDDKSKQMPLIRMIMSYMDLSSILRETLQKR